METSCAIVAVPAPAQTLEADPALIDLPDHIEEMHWIVVVAFEFVMPKLAAVGRLAGLAFAPLA